MKPLQIWAYLDNSFFHSFQGGTKGKMLKKTMYSYGNFSAFFLWSPLGNYEKNSCLNKLKFGEASQNQKRSICWKFKLSISLGTQKSPSTIQAWAKLNKPFWSRLKWWFNEFDSNLVWEMFQLWTKMNWIWKTDFPWHHCLGHRDGDCSIHRVKTLPWQTT